MGKVKTKLKSILISASLILCGYFALPYLLKIVGRSLIREDQVKPADLIISLSGDAECLRELQAAKLHQQGLARVIVASGYAYGAALDTSAASKDYLQSLGVPEEELIAVPGGNNTRLEAKNIATLMRARGWRTAIIVTSAFHSRRALFTFEQAAPDLTFYSAPAPIQENSWNPEQWWKQRRACGTTLREVLAWSNTVVTKWQ